ncbi:MAG TPA: hypothetical protein PKN96_08660 [Flavobacterium sp.]|uniref:hypothetical protein n=1 Tax=Flavobacterium sp. TaxID=239 RepID=UPI002C461A30|nr:hypothetical protein [Flavobacterium sp.]HNP33350.1 hypothetical protein [Flavobacterium sp.]
MKTIIGIFTLLLSFGLQAQNQNKKIETVETTTTVKDNKGEHKVVKKQEIKEVQDIELKEVPKGTLNTDIQPTPTQATVTTTVNVDGQERVVDVDHSAYYSYNGERYHVLSDKAGYTVSSPNNVSVLRRTSNNNYIYKNKDKFSVGYFDANGNLVLETYDEKTDKVTIETYTLQK